MLREYLARPRFRHGDLLDAEIGFGGLGGRTAHQHDAAVGVGDHGLAPTKRQRGLPQPSRCAAEVKPTSPAHIGGVRTSSAGNRAFGGNDAVAAGALGLVELGIGPLHQLLGILADAELGDAERGGDGRSC